MTPSVRFPRGAAARVGAACSTPLAMAIALVLPTLAAGVFWVAQPETPASTGTMSVSTTAAGGEADPLASSRAALTNTVLPLQILGGGMAELTDGSAKLDDGAHQMSDGLHQARSGSAELADGMTQLRQGLWQLGDGSSQVSGGVDRVVGALTAVGAAQGQIELIVQQTLDSLAVSTDPGAAASADQLRPVLDLVRTQGVNAGVLTDLEKLRDGARTVAYQLDDPSSPFVDGIVRATDGSAQLRDGLVLLDDGGVRLVDGTTRLVGGVGPMETMFTTLRSNVDKASTSLPAADRIESDPSGAASTYVVRPATDAWPYLAAAFAVVAAGLVGLFVPRARAAVAAGVVVVAAVALGLAFADTGASVGSVATSTLLIAAWVAAIGSAARALRAALGTVRAGALLAVIAVVSLVLGGLEHRGHSWLVTGFTPVGQLGRSLGDATSGGAAAVTLVSLVAALVTMVVAAAVLSAHHHEPNVESAFGDETESERIDDKTESERIEGDTVSSSVR